MNEHMMTHNNVCSYVVLAFLLFQYFLYVFTVSIKILKLRIVLTSGFVVSTISVGQTRML
jgi:hypothetical protein